MFYNLIEKDLDKLQYLNYYFKFNQNKLKELQKFLTIDNKYKRSLHI